MAGLSNIPTSPNYAAHQEEVHKLGDARTVLGLPWLRHNNVSLGLAHTMMTFHAEYCLNHCYTQVISSQLQLLKAFYKMP